MAVTAAAEASGLGVGAEYDLIAKEALPFLQRFRKEILVVPEDVTGAGEFLCRAVMQAIDKPGAPPMQYLETPAG